MTFKQGNTEGSKTGAKPKLTQWNNLVGWLVGYGGLQFNEAMEKLANGEDIPKPQKEFIEHYKDLLEYHQPKLARQVDKNNNDVQKVEFIIRSPESK